MTTSTESTCELSSTSIISILLMVVVVVGSEIAHLFQFALIFKNKSSVGLSQLWLCFVTIASVSSLFAYFLYNGPRVDCCSSIWSDSQCAYALFPVYATIVAALNYPPTFILAVFYFRPDHKIQAIIRQRSHAISCMVVTLIFLAVILGIGFTYLHDDGITGDKTHTYGLVITIIAGIFTSITWLPQIYEMYLRKSPGNFSPIMLRILTIGSTIALLQYFVFEKQPFVQGIPLIFQTAEQWILSWLSRRYRDRLFSNEKSESEMENESGGDGYNAQPTETQAFIDGKNRDLL